MAGDDRAGLELLDGVQGTEPLPRAASFRFAEVQLHVSVHGIACHYEPDGGNVQCARAIGVGVAQLDRAELLSFQFEHPVGQRLRGHVPVGDLAGEARAPESAEPSGPVLGVHVRHDARRGDDPGIRKAFEHRRDPEKAIAVRVGHEDGGHVLTGPGNQSANARDSSLVMSASTKTASRTPWMSIDAVGDHIRLPHPGEDRRTPPASTAPHTPSTPTLPLPLP